MKKKIIMKFHPYDPELLSKNRYIKYTDTFELVNKVNELINKYGKTDEIYLQFDEGKNRLYLMSDIHHTYGDIYIDDDNGMFDLGNLGVIND